MKKTGRLSKEEWQFIDDNSSSLSPEEIAAALNRDLEPILRYLAKTGVAESPKEFEIQAEYDLKSRLYWREIQRQFNEDEQEMFLYHWSKIVAQFRKDILPTEELQIIHLIKLEILLNRNLTSRQDCLLRINSIQDDITKERKKEPLDYDKIAFLERQQALLTQSNLTLTAEYKDLQIKISSFFKELKATREQRIKDIENSKETFSGLQLKIIRDPEFRKEMNTYMEKMRIAAEEEKRRLGVDYHQYADGDLDQPFLTPETVI